MMTARKLGLTKKELEALLAVRDGLASGAYKHVRNFSDTKSKKPMFNMTQACVSDSCGTIGCIGGWMARQMGLNEIEAHDYVYETPGKTYDLFFPKGLNGDWDKITPKQAVKAIDNFLETGDPKWPQVAPKLVD